jgi:hypothetical protein
MSTQPLGFDETTTWEPANETQWVSSSPIQNNAPWFQSAAKQLSDFLKLGQDWDGYGSSGISSTALRAAFDLVSTIDVQGLKAPHIAPITGGGIQIIFEQDDRNVEFEILPNGFIEYVSCTEDDTCDEGVISQVRTPQNVVSWLLAA